MSGGGSQSTTSSTEPWGAQKGYLKDIFGQAQKLYNQEGPNLYPGQTTAPFNPNETAAQNSYLDYAKNFAPNIASQASGAFGTISNPDLMLNPNNNPYLQQYANAAVQPIYSNLTQNVLPSISNAAFGSHLTGSSRQGIAEGLAAQSANQQAGNVTANIYSNAYGQGLQSLGQSLALAPTVQQLGAAGPEAQSAVGAQQRAYEQALLDQQVQNYQYQQELPYNKLATYLSMIQGNYGGTTTSSTPLGSNNPLLTGLGGAATGAALGSPLGPWGMAGGAGLGALLGLFT